MRRPHPPRRPFAHMPFAVVALAALAACAGASGPDPRAGFTERNAGKTLISHDAAGGTRAAYLDPGGELFLWVPGESAAVSGAWRYQLVRTGGSNTFQGAGVIDQQVAVPDSAWGICTRADAAAQVPPAPDGSDWSCALLPAYEAQITERAEGDLFNLGSGQVPAPMPPGRRLGAGELAALR